MLFISFGIRLLFTTKKIPKKTYKIALNFLFIISIVIDTYIIRFIFYFYIIIGIIHSIAIIFIVKITNEFFSFIGITGQICSGKSTVSDYLREHYKAKVIKFDELNREVLEDENVKNIIKNKFGDDVFIIDENSNKRVLNKQKMQKIIFSDYKKKKMLERITHPRVFMKFLFRLFIEKCLHNEKYVYVENAILLHFLILKVCCVKVISVCVENREILLNRLMERSNIGQNEAEKIFKNQMSISEFKKQSDFVIINEGSEEELYKKVDDVLNKLKDSIN